VKGELSYQDCLFKGYEYDKRMGFKAIWLDGSWLGDALLSFLLLCVVEKELVPALWPATKLLLLKMSC
jgi:hypothetical protein